MRCIKRLLRCIFPAVILLFAASCSNNTNYTSEDLLSLTPQEVLVRYINAWDSGNVGAEEIFLSPAMKTVSIIHTKEDTVKIVSLKEIEEFASSNQTEMLYNLNVYDIVLEVSRNNEITENYELRYYVGREGENFPWLIYDIWDGKSFWAPSDMDTTYSDIMHLE